MTVPRNIFKKVKTFRPKIFINIKKNNKKFEKITRNTIYKSKCTG